MSDVIIKELVHKVNTINNMSMLQKYDIGADAKNVFYEQRDGEQVDLQYKTRLFDDCLNISERTGTASGESSHIEGLFNLASGAVSHAEGTRNKAYGRGSHVEGCANTEYQKIKWEASLNYQIVLSINKINVSPQGIGYYIIPEKDSDIATAQANNLSYLMIRDHSEQTQYTLYEDMHSILTSLKSYVSDDSKDVMIKSLNDDSLKPYLQEFGVYRLLNVDPNKVITGFNPLIALVDIYSQSLDYAYLGTQIDDGYGEATHIEGMGNISQDDYQHVQGKFNKPLMDCAHIIGGGQSDTSRKNIHTVDWDGNAEFAGDVIAGGCGGSEPVSLLQIANANKKPLVIYEKEAESYTNNYTMGDKVLEALLAGRQVFVQLIDQNNTNTRALYSPVITYHLPINGNSRLELFYLKNGFNPSDMTSAFGQIPMLLSKTYIDTPLK